ncbi:hypothetical protein CPB85DRAFT_1325946 [Mucidula mucida]|nr:hypothetical protein CPB85DRAFT_1325946 [Mucidula mucida]
MFRDCEEEQLGDPNVKMDVIQLCFSTYKLSDFGSANKVSNKFAKLIQPTALRSPEVIIGAEWGTKADIWNFACLKTGLSQPQTHLAQIVALFGPFPRSFLDKGNCKLTARYFDSNEGNLLNDGGLFTEQAPQPPGEIPLFVDFLSKGLIIDPDQRCHPWLDGVE